MGKLLGVLDRAHQRLTHTADDRRQQATWMRSMRGERGSTRRRGVLDTVMIVSVGLALAGFGIWFFGFAGSSLPGLSAAREASGPPRRIPSVHVIVLGIDPGVANTGYGVVAHHRGAPGRARRRGDRDRRRCSTPAPGWRPSTSASAR